MKSNIYSQYSQKKRRSSESEEPQEQEPPKKARGRPRNTPLKAIPEATEEPTTSTATPKTLQTPKKAGSRSRNNSTSSVTGTTTPKRGKKPVLGHVSEENEDEQEPAVKKTLSSCSQTHILDPTAQI